MVLVFIFLSIVFLITLFTTLVTLSNIHIKIENFEVGNMLSKKEDIKLKNKSEYKVEVSLYFLGKIKWISTNLNNKKMKNMYSKMQLEKIDFNKIRKDFELENLKEIKRVKPKITFLNLDINIGTEDVLITSFLVFLISTFISIILPYTIKKYEKDKYNYQIKPIYENKNVYNIKFDGIFELKMVHIINIIYIFTKKRRVEKNGQSSNRRSYGYSYE